MKLVREATADGSEKKSEKNASPALLHALKIKLNLYYIKQFRSLVGTDAISKETVKLINQSSLHLNFHGVDFVDLDLKCESQNSLSWLDFSDTTFENVTLKNWNCTRSDFSNSIIKINVGIVFCDFSNGKFKKAEIQTTSIQDCNFARADLSEATLGIKFKVLWMSFGENFHNVSNKMLGNDFRHAIINETIQRTLIGHMTLLRNGMEEKQDHPWLNFLKKSAAKSNLPIPLYSIQDAIILQWLGGNNVTQKSLQQKIILLDYDDVKPLSDNMKRLICSYTIIPMSDSFQDLPEKSKAGCLSRVTKSIWSLFSPTTTSKNGQKAEAQSGHTP